MHTAAYMLNMRMYLLHLSRLSAESVTGYQPQNVYGCCKLQRTFTYVRFLPYSVHSGEDINSRIARATFCQANK